MTVRTAGGKPVRDGWEVLLGGLLPAETVKIVGDPFWLKVNTRWAKGEAHVIVTSHRLVAGVCGSSLFKGKSVKEAVKVPLEEIGDSVGTYTRPFGKGDPVFGLDCDSRFGTFDAYFNTFEEQDEVFNLLSGAIALRGWE